MTPSAETKSVAEVLLAAADRLSKRGAWCRETYARDARGEPTGVCQGDAVAFCMMGAIRREAIDNYYAESSARTIILRLLPHESPAGFNDNPRRKKREVVALLRQAAALAQEPRDAL